MEAFDDTPGVPLVNVRSYLNACCYLILSIIYEIRATIFSANIFEEYVLLSALLHFFVDLKCT